jgi:biotin carboxyl carrier protein
MTADRDQAAQSRALIARLADEVLPALMERMAQSELAELEVREQGWRIRLRRPIENGHALQPVGPGAAVHAQSTASTSAHAAPRETDPGLVTSPAVGYFAPLKGLEAGARVRSGDPVGHVDVLGVRHEVVSTVSGALKAYEVQSGEAVEFGQAIVCVEVEA